MPLLRHTVLSIKVSFIYFEMTEIQLNMLSQSEEQQDVLSSFWNPVLFLKEGIASSRNNGMISVLSYFFLIKILYVI